MGVRVIALSVALLLPSCDSRQLEPNAAPAETIARGEDAFARLGCGACHSLSGAWPQGTSGPSLDDFSKRGVIAGSRPNRPDTLAAFLLDPSGTAMPRVPMTPRQAEDIAAFLHAR